MLAMLSLITHHVKLVSSKTHQAPTRDVVIDNIVLSTYPIVRGYCGSAGLSGILTTNIFTKKNSSAQMMTLSPQGQKNDFCTLGAR